MSKAYESGLRGLARGDAYEKALNDEPAPPACSARFGDSLSYITDDRDSDRRMELVIQQGGNGDWYVSVVEEGSKAIRGVRLCTSGGASTAAPGLTSAIAAAYRALWNAQNAGGEQ